MFLALIFSFGLQAKCLYQVDSSGSEVSWVAYKTPEKVGVKGEFKKFDFASPKSKTYKELVEGAVYSIHTDSVKTGDKGRDSRLTKHFFKVMETPYIRGYVTNFNVERKSCRHSVNFKWDYQNSST
jgi:polyisoprenoid-binding protein YceI